MIKVLNLFAGIGGNRKLWKDVEVTAVEKNPEIAKIYQDFFPNDKVIVADAYEYILTHYDEYDFIWASPPCPSHSKIRFVATKSKTYDAILPDLKLYQLIIFLKYYAKGKWVVENVKSYYEPLIKPQESGRHYFWSNFNILNKKGDGLSHNQRGTSKIGFDLKNYQLKDRKDQILRNCVYPNLGLHIFKCAFSETQKTL